MPNRKNLWSIYSDEFLEEASRGYDKLIGGIVRIEETVGRNPVTDTVTNTLSKMQSVVDHHLVLRIKENGEDQE